jgi:hypothetical protein
MQYTEENYTELYNNLPKGLRDLVLSGELSNLSNAIAMRYALTPEQTSDLEPAIEDVALGLVTLDELKENIKYQLGLDTDKANTIAREAINTILSDYTEELRLTRKYKIELDEKLRKEKNITANIEEEVVINSVSKSVAESILGAVTEKEDIPNTKTEPSIDSNKKVSDWYAGSKTKTQMEMDSFTGGIPVNNVKVKTNSEYSDLREKKSEPVVKVEQAPQVKEEVKIAAPKKDVWDNLMINKADTSNINTNQKINNNTTPSLVQSISGESKDLEKSMVQVEQQIFTLTQAINKLLSQDAFIKPSANAQKDIFEQGSDKYKDLNDKIEALIKRVDDIQSQMQIAKMTAKEEAMKPVSFDISNVKVNDIEKNSADILTKKEDLFSIDNLLNNRKVDNIIASAPSVVSSSVSANAMDAIFENRKAQNDISVKKVDTVIMPSANIVSEIIPKIENIIVKPDPKLNVQSDIDFLKEMTRPVAETTIKSIKEEILPQSDESKIKSLQDKIKSLNKGIGYGGISSAGNVDNLVSDPYRQAI